MHTLNFDYQLPPFEKTIQLYGDRAGGQGDFVFAGLAELHDDKFVLIKGHSNSLEQPDDWRRFLRLINLAQRLKKPLLLWNLSLSSVATNQHHTSLALGTAIQDTKMQLLRIPEPVIKVFDENCKLMSVMQEIGWGDATIVVSPDEEAFEEVTDYIRIVDESTEVPEQISDLLQRLSKLDPDKLFANRMASIQNLTESNG